MNTENLIPFLNEGTGGTYTVVAPDFTEADFVPTEKTVPGNILTPFGFEFPFEHIEEGNEDEYFRIDRKIYSEKIFRLTFEKFVEKLQEKARSAGANYILIKVTRNSQAVSWKWMVSADCIFLLAIAFKKDMGMFHPIK